MSNKQIVVLLEEDPKHSIFKEVSELLGLSGIDPLDCIEPESHMLSTIYKDVFTSSTANDLLAYLIKRRGKPLVFDILNSIYGDTERLTLVNTTLLSDEDIRFMSESLPNILVFKLVGPARVAATTIYDASKAYRDTKGI